MADVSLTITVPSDKVAILTPWYLAERPIPQIPDPAWIDPGDGSSAPMIDEYNLKTWVEMGIRDHVKLICRRGKLKLDMAADAATWDDNIVG